MSTTGQIVQDALQEAGILAAGESAAAEDFALGLRRLNQMMEKWEIDGIDLGYFAQTGSSDTCPIPSWAERAVTLSLAVTLCPSFQLSVTPELAALQSEAYDALLRQALNMKLRGADMTHLPYGSGHFSRYDISSEQ